MGDTSLHLLTDILKGVSRSFYLSLRVLPKPLRVPLSLGYLLARSVDTIADTQIVPREKRIELLHLFKKLLSPDISSKSTVKEILGALVGKETLRAERTLLEHLPQCIEAYYALEVEDRNQLVFVLNGLIEGMINDLLTFPSESFSNINALHTLEELDRYTYYAAGIVGEFWTTLCFAHLPSMSHLAQNELTESGICFGKGLQLTNVLKDVPRDLRNGRCYIPTSLLEMVGLTPKDLLDPGNLPRLRPVMKHLTQLATDHLERGREYILAIPKKEYRLRLACILPLWIALRTLRLLLKSEQTLTPESNLRIPRSEVYRLVRLAMVSVCFDSIMDGYTISFRNEVESAV